MPIDQISLKEFSVFEEVDISFSPGLNVFIGENATGKTHLMKVLYSMLRPFQEVRQGVLGSTEYSKSLTDKLVAVFVPDEWLPGRLVHRRVGRNTAKVALSYDGMKVAFSLNTHGVMKVTSFQPLSETRCVFLPSREALAMFPGFVSAYENRELSFDETYFDLCKALSAVPLRGPRLARAAELIEPLEDVLGGRVVLQGGKFYVSGEKKQGILEAHLLAEGFRKIASILHLIVNGSLVKNSVLFWDEPEANLNPKLVVRIAKLLRSLAAGGVQVFVTTHDFLLSQELSLAASYQTAPAVDMSFFAFARDSRGHVTAEKGATLADLDNNAIVQEFAAHYQREQQMMSPTTQPGDGH